MDSLGTQDDEVPRQLFDLDQSDSEMRVDRAPQIRTRSKRKHEQESRPTAASRAARRPEGEGPVLLLSVEEAARWLSIGRSKTYELIAAGVLESVHIGRSTRVPVAALHDLLDRLRDAADRRAAPRS